jgi:Predicted nucleic acid-binding protein, contains PIN domain
LRVVDASAIVDVVARTLRGKRVRRELAGQTLVAPELLDVEALSALSRMARAGTITWQHAELAVRWLGELQIDRMSHEHLAARAWQLRERVRITDGFYLAAAEVQRCPLVTCDGRLKRAPLQGVTIIHVS